MEKMQIRFLGTGTSTGIPSIGCHCATCRSTDSRDKRLRTSAIVSVGKVNLLIDCGPDFRSQILEAGCPKLDGLLVTHQHYDHVGGIDDLRPYCYPSGFDIYCDSKVEHALRRQVPYAFADGKDHYPGAPVFHTHIIKPYHSFKVEGVEVTPLAVNHYLLDILGFRIGPLAYITDAKVIPQTTIDAVRGVDTLVINALRIKEHMSHINLSQALDVIKVIKPRVAYLTHLSHDMGLHAEVSRTLPQNVFIAYDGLTVDNPNGGTAWEECRTPT